MTVEVFGGDRIRKKIAEVADGLDEVSEKSLEKLANEIIDAAKLLVPIDTGSLQKSIRKETVLHRSKHTKSVSVRAGGYITNPRSNRLVDYAVFIELGTSRSIAQPFLRPAFEQVKSKTAMIVKKEYETEI